MNVFDSDKVRHILASKGKLDELFNTYDGTLPELEDISTACNTASEQHLG